MTRIHNPSRTSYSNSIIGSEPTSINYNPFFLPEWKFAGYREGQKLPVDTIPYLIVVSAGDTNLWGDNAIVDDNGVSPQGQKLQNIIDSIPTKFPNRNYFKIVRLLIPPGKICIDRQILIHVSFLIISGDDYQTTNIIFKPNLNTRYDVELSASGSNDGDDFDLSLMTFGESNGGWIFPGRACFRIQTKRIHPDYELEFVNAPEERKDFYYGSVNFPWKSGIRVRQSEPIAGTRGSNRLYLDSDPLGVYVGSYVLLYCCNTTNWLQSIDVPSNHWRAIPIAQTRIHRVTNINLAEKYIEFDRSLEFDVWARQDFNGLQMSNDSSYRSVIVPLVIVEGIGIERLKISQPMSNVPAVSGGTYDLIPSDADYNYINLAAEYTMHGIVIKWSVNCFARQIKTYYTGSHAIATEFCKNITVEDCFFEGSWNKGKGGNGYARFSKIWDSLIQRNVLQKIRHLTLQWSASCNVVKDNHLDCDLNLHGGWERMNLLESNTGQVPFNHRFGTDPSLGVSNYSIWYPIWWGAGKHAGKWSTATGDRNFFWNNQLAKQQTNGGEYIPYYNKKQVEYIFGASNSVFYPSQWTHLIKNGIPISAWSNNETIDFSSVPNEGVNCSHFAKTSLHQMAINSNASLPALPDYYGAGNVEINLASIKTRISSRFSSLELDNNFVKKVKDASFSGNDLSGFQEIATVLFENTLSPPSIVFQMGGGVFELNEYMGIKSDITFFILLRPDEFINSGERFLEVRWTDRNYQLYSTPPYDRLILGFFQGTSFVRGITAASGEVPKGKWTCLSISIDFNNGDASLWVYRFNKRIASGLDKPNGAFSTALIGSRSNGLNPFTGRFAEFIVYHASLGDYDRHSIMERILFDYNLL